ncbi:MAG: hypothetical protein ACTTKO_07950 [Candidatus Limimorpha sp.]
MIDLQAKIHDKFTLEFKVGFRTKTTKEQVLFDSNDFVLNTWIFIPNSLDVNPSTYNKEQFFRDIKSDLRLITPPYPLHQLANDDELLPYVSLRDNIKDLTVSNTHADAFVHAVKMYCAIAKSAFRDTFQHVSSLTDSETSRWEALIFLDDAEHVLLRYRQLQDLLKASAGQQLLEYYRYGDEFLSNVFEQYAFRLLNTLPTLEGESGELVRKRFVKALAGEKEYKKQHGYLCVDPDDANHNSDFVYHASLLKKFVESDLFLKANKIKNSFFVEQVLFGFAAIIAMLSSTLLTIYFQNQFNSYALPFLISAVLIYALKDRLKDWMKVLFSNKASNKFYDHKTYFRINGEKIGWNKDSFGFVRQDSIMPEVQRLRHRSPLQEVVNKKDEKVILFRKRVRLWRSKLAKASPFPLQGINDIMRYNITEYVRKMDDPHTSLSSTLGEDGFTPVIGEKLYYVYFIMQYAFEEQIEYKSVKVACNRNGIQEITVM